jgi:hypothetical protein
LLFINVKDGGMDLKVDISLRFTCCKLYS